MSTASFPVTHCTYPAKTDNVVISGCSGEKASVGTSCSFYCRDVSSFFSNTFIGSLRSLCTANGWDNNVRDNNNKFLLDKPFLNCKSVCPPLSSVGDLNILGNCENNLKQQDGKKCTVTCINGIIKQTQKREIDLICNNGQWAIIPNTILDYKIECISDYVAEKLPISLPSYSKCPDIELNHACKTVNNRFICSVWCPESLINGFDKISIDLTCINGKWTHIVKGRIVFLREKLTCASFKK
ncbi:hypothetical protein MHBO_000553 [Bonamia ostreae]|uniref:Sushi domain-containing protein n=1 Tax=Bonamia ostreae TaxID=126728 RepID=A0ABV2AGL0_9EUKA